MTALPQCDKRARSTEARGQAATSKVVLLVTGFLFWLIAWQLSSLSASLLAVGIAVWAGQAAWAVFARKADLFGPLGFPSLYIGFVMLGPSTYVWLAGESIGSFLKPSDLNTEAIIASAGTFLAFTLGASIVSLGRHWRTMPYSRVQRPLLAAPLARQVLRLIARVVLGLCVVQRLAVLWIFGFGSFGLQGNSFSGFFVVEPLVTVAIMGATLSLLAGGLRFRSLRPSDLLDWGILACFIVLSLAIGSRSELIAPIVAAAYWWYRSSGASNKVIIVLIALAYSVLTLLQLVRTAFSSAGINPEGLTFGFEVLLRPVASPTKIAAQVTDVINVHGPLMGSTYTTAVKYLLPDPLGSWVFGGPPTGAGSLSFAKLAGYGGPAGLGFSFSGEPLLNFGLGWFWLVPMLMGVLVAVLYARTLRRGSFVAGLWYVVLIARIPLSMRDDFLQILKGVVFAFLFVYLSVAISRSIGSRISGSVGPWVGGLATSVHSGGPKKGPSGAHLGRG